MSRALQPFETTELCSHGCGKQAKYRAKHRPFKLCCSEFSMQCEIIREKNSKGKLGTSQTFDYKLLYKTLPQETKDRMAWSRGLTLTTFEECKTMGKRKKFLIGERGHKCERCNLSEWLCEPISIEMDHIDGDRNNNTRENLRLLCPNCHAQTETWKGKNTYKKSVPEETIISTINEYISKNEKFIISDILKQIGITPLGHNYRRIYKIMDKMGINYDEVRNSQNYLDK